jgi:hypothetical protein
MDGFTDAHCRIAEAAAEIVAVAHPPAVMFPVSQAA